MPLRISFWMNKCLSSMCFALRDDPILVAMLLPAEESVWILMLTLDVGEFHQEVA